MLDFDFFEVLDSVTIARSRKHIEKYYDTTSIGKFPERLIPKSYTPHLTDLKDAISYNEIFEQLTKLNLDVTVHLITFCRAEWKSTPSCGDNKVNVGFTQATREAWYPPPYGDKLDEAYGKLRLFFQSDASLRIKELIDTTIESIDDYGQPSQRSISQIFLMLTNMALTTRTAMTLQASAKSAD